MVTKLQFYVKCVIICAYFSNKNLYKERQVLTMSITRLKNVAEVGMFFVEVTAIADGESCLRKVTSKPVGIEDVKKFEQICTNLQGTGCVPTLRVIRQMKDGLSLERWFSQYLFEDYWPSLARLCNHTWQQVTEDGIYQVEVK